MQSQALQSKVPLAVERYGWYKSAEVHTVKKDFPKKKLAVLAACALGVPLLVWYAFQGLKPDDEIVQADNSDAAFDGSGPALSSGRGSSGAWTLDTITERIEGVAQSAPLYDEALKVEDIPIVSGCAVMQVGHAKSCECYTAQGTVLEIDHRQCLAYFERGSFDPRGKARYPVIEAYVPPLAGPAEGGGQVASETPPARSEARGSG